MSHGFTRQRVGYKFLSAWLPSVFLGLCLTAMAGTPPLSSAPPAHATTNELVILLHGLARRPASMGQLAAALQQAGFTVTNAPQRLGPVRFELGVIAGDRTINGINSKLIPGVDDGKVSLGRTRVEGMKAHTVVPSAHPFLMKNREAIRQTILFLQTGAFAPRQPLPAADPTLPAHLRPSATEAGKP